MIELNVWSLTMSIVLDIETPKVRKIRDLTGADSDIEAIETALDRFVNDYDHQKRPAEIGELPESFWKELFEQPQLPKHLSASRAIIDERNEDRF